MSECEAADGDIYIINTTTLRLLKSNIDIELGKICGQIRQVLRFGDRIAAVGDVGGCLMDDKGVAVVNWRKCNSESIREQMATIERMAIMPSGSLALIRIDNKAYTTQFYEINTSNGETRTVCEVPFRARQDLHGRLLDGAVPFGSGIVCHAYSYDVSGNFFCDFEKGTWSTLECGPRCIVEDAKLVTCGRLVASKRVDNNVVLNTYGLDFKVASKFCLPIEYPEPTRPPCLVDVLSDGSFAVAGGKLNRDITIYTLCKESTK